MEEVRSKSQRLQKRIGEEVDSGIVTEAPISSALL